jgi:hypothetical protein
MSLTIVPLLVIDYYKSLGAAPRLPRSPTPLDHIRYSLHKIYYQYTITFSGYMLDPAERLLFDVLLGLMLCATIWCSTLITPPLGRLVLHGLNGGVLDGPEAKDLGKVVVEGWSGNMTMRVMGSVGAVENCTAAGL